MKVMVFGFGEMGRELVDECLEYARNIEIVALVDNAPKQSRYKDIDIIEPDSLNKYIYDEIWVSTVYYSEIVKQLVEKFSINEKIIHFAEPVVPILDEILRDKYKNELDNLNLVDDEKKEVLTYLKNNKLRMYCYKFYDEYFGKDTEICYDASKGLYYGIYNGKHMYLARQFNTEQKARAYYNAVTMEQDNRCPHCYWNNKGFANLKGVGIDVGAAEGIFALKIIEQLDKIYLIEVDERWIEALRYTFEPYKDKVVIMQKFIGDVDTSINARLDSLLCNENINFIKMDIEGMELKALQGAEQILLQNNVKLAVCVYHNQNDNEEITNWLEQRGYKCSNSRGYVVCQGEWELKMMNPNFRRALLYAEKE